MKTRTTRLHLILLATTLLLAACAGDPDGKLRLDSTLVARGGDAETADDIRVLLLESARRATADLSRPSGYERRDATRVPLPAALEPTAALLRGYGYGRLADAVLADINRGLERGAARAMPALETVIAELDMPDVNALLRGSNGGASGLLCSAGREDLVREYGTALKFGLADSGYYNSLKIMIDRYNGIPILSDVEIPDLEPELRERGVNAICLRMMAEEENMRSDPEARPNDTIRRLFLRPH